MKIQIKELGAIKDGTIDLSKKLNLFCGPNGTGKTYMAYVVYGLMKAQIHVGVNRELASELIEKKKLLYTIEFGALDKYREDLLENFKGELDELFGIGQVLAKQYFEETKIDFIDSKEDFKNTLFNCEFQARLTVTSIEINISKNAKSEMLELELIEKTISSKDIDRFSFFLYSSILSFLATYPISSTYILPVERNSIFTFSKELSIRKQEAVDHFHAMTGKDKVDKFDLLFNRTTRYPLPIKDGLLVADDLAEITKKISEYFELATEIENELLHGKIQITSEGEIQFQPDKAIKRHLPIHMTASIIKSLSSLVVYLKHLAQKNDLILIDEPEINLHPDNQIILTKLFARLVNKGFRLVISTHSDYIVREFNNLIMLSSEKPEIKKLAEKFYYKADEIVNQKDISVLYFNYPKKHRGNKQVTVESIEIGESGFEIPSIDLTIEKQNNIAEELFYNLKYGDSNE
jgi:energy-coupling factor transporter ATP-binding protein EcfA2